MVKKCAILSHGRNFCLTELVHESLTSTPVRKTKMNWIQILYTDDIAGSNKLHAKVVVNKAKHRNITKPNNRKHRSNVNEC